MPSSPAPQKDAVDAANNNSVLSGGRESENEAGEIEEVDNENDTEAELAIDPSLVIELEDVGLPLRTFRFHIGDHEYYWAALQSDPSKSQIVAHVMGARDALPADKSFVVRYGLLFATMKGQVAKKLCDSKKNGGGDLDVVIRSFFAKLFSPEERASHFVAMRETVKRPRHMSVLDFWYRLEKLNRYGEFLPGDAASLTDEEMKRSFFHAQPERWKVAFPPAKLDSAKFLTIFSSMIVAEERAQASMEENVRRQKSALKSSPPPPQVFLEDYAEAAELDGLHYASFLGTQCFKLSSKLSEKAADPQPSAGNKRVFRDFATMFREQGFLSLQNGVEQERKKRQKAADDESDTLFSRRTNDEINGDSGLAENLPPHSVILPPPPEARRPPPPPVARRVESPQGRNRNSRNNDRPTCGWV